MKIASIIANATRATTVMELNMGKPQYRVGTEEPVRQKAAGGRSSKEPLRPIVGAQGEVAAMQMMIASHFSKPLPQRSPRDLEARVELIVSSVSRMSGYVLMGLALLGLAYLVIPG